MNRGRLASGNLPKLRKPAEMIQPDIVKVRRHPAHAIDPPRISLLFHHIPAIKRITPALSIFTEKIWRHAGDDLGIEFGVQAKQIGMSPNIGAIEIDEDRNIAHHTDRVLCAISAKRLPLLKEEKLDGTANIEFMVQFRPYSCERRWLTMSQFAGPAVPAFELVTRTQSVEQNKVVEPPLILPAEAFVTRIRIRCGGVHEITRRFK